MFNRRWIAAVGLGATLMLSACGGGSDNDDPAPAAGETASTDSSSASGSTPAASMQAGPTRTPVIVANIAEQPCSILTNEEVQAATGAAVLIADGLPDKVQPFCKWIIDRESQPSPAAGEVVISLIGNTTLFNAAGKTAVTGVGDEAYAIPATGSGLTTGYVLWVRTGSQTLQISVQPEDPRVLASDSAKREAFNTRAAEMAQAAAKVAVTRL